jgi:hypothetical protein
MEWDDDDDDVLDLGLKPEHDPAKGIMVEGLDTLDALYVQYKAE